MLHSQPSLWNLWGLGQGRVQNTCTLTLVLERRKKQKKAGEEKESCVDWTWVRSYKLGTFSVIEGLVCFRVLLRNARPLHSLRCLSEYQNTKRVVVHVCEIFFKSRFGGNADAFCNSNISHCRLKTNHLKPSELCHGLLLRCPEALHTLKDWLIRESY